MRNRILISSLAMASTLLFVGCSQQSAPSSIAHSAGMTGSVVGGQQPVTGATIQLYAVGTTADQSAATPLLTSTVKTDSLGNFGISNLYTCPTPTTLVYLVATGGNPGLAAGTNNAAITLMSPLGQCQTLLATNPSPYFVINEVSTVATVAALSRYMTSTSTLGSGTSDAAALATAFTLASNFADTNSATTPGRNIPTGLAVPTTLINTLADIVSTCVNTTGGVAGDSTPCGNLFSYANSPTTPTTVVGALLNIFANPTNNITSLLGLATGVGAPFQPALTVPPPNWTVALNTAAPPVTGSPSSFSFGATSVNAVSSGLNITITNTGSANATLTSLSITGANASSFFIVGGNCPTTLGAGSSCFVTLTFYPTATGIFYADLAIANSGSATPVYVALTGTGI